MGVISTSVKGSAVVTDCAVVIVATPEPPAGLAAMSAGRSPVAVCPPVATGMNRPLLRCRVTHHWTRVWATVARTALNAKQ